MDGLTSSRDGGGRVAIAQQRASVELGGETAQVEFRPAEIVKRQTARWRGVIAETAHVTSHQPFEYRYKQAKHLLIATEQSARYDGETLLEGLPRSMRREMSCKLTLVPAYRSFTGWQVPRLLSRWTYVYIDPRVVPIDPSTGFADTDFAPRMFFENSDLWHTMLRLKSLIGDPDASVGLYVQALSVVLAHDLMRLNDGAQATKSKSRGGLASWQQKRVASFIDEHLALNVALAELADMVGLSAYHFLRAFKQSFGVPPHRYCVARRIERAKALLADPDASVIGVALDLGFSSASAFSTAFRRVTGHTPSDYRRSLE